METTRALNLNGKTRNLLWSVGLVLQKECVKLVSDQEILLCWLPPTAMETHLSLLREISPSWVQSSSLALNFSHPMAGNPSFTKRRTTWKKRRRCTVGPVSQGEPRVKQYQPNSDHKDYQLQENHSRLQQPGEERDPVHNNHQNSGVSKKEAERIELEKFPNSNSFVIWAMNFKIEVCSNYSSPTGVVVWMNEIDSAKNVDDWKSSNSMLGTLFRYN